MKHNNVVPNAHFHKDWQRFVKTWFDQPAKKAARRAARVSKAKRIAPRPLSSLRPIVRGQTNKYNSKIRAGRGFSLAELKAAKINRHQANGIGISVDHRRKNKSEESFQVNVDRLKVYKSKLVLFPRNATSKRVKKGDSSKEERQNAKQVSGNHVLPIAIKETRIKARKITKDERDATVTKVLRKALTDSKLWGVREKRAKAKADSAASKAKKTEDAAEE
jgi:large subunit ribosomal protein L13e